VRIPNPRHTAQSGAGACDEKELMEYQVEVFLNGVRRLHYADATKKKQAGFVLPG